MISTSRVTRRRCLVFGIFAAWWPAALKVTFLHLHLASPLGIFHPSAFSDRVAPCRDGPVILVFVFVPGSRAGCQGLKWDQVEFKLGETKPFFFFIAFSKAFLLSIHLLLCRSVCPPAAQTASQPSIQHLSLSFRVFYSLLDFREQRMVVTILPNWHVLRPVVYQFWQVQIRVVWVSSVHSVHTRRGTHSDVVHERVLLKHCESEYQAMPVGWSIHLSSHCTWHHVLAILDDGSSYSPHVATKGSTWSLVFARFWLPISYW